MIPKDCYAVIFSNSLRSHDIEYEQTAKKLDTLVTKQPGFLGMESTRNADSGFGITVSYWKDLQSIRAWRNNPEHKEAQKRGKEQWYSHYTTTITKIERSYGYGNEQRLAVS